MITLTIIATLAVLAPVAWLLAETSRRWMVFVAVPALLAAPIGFYLYGLTLLGYAAQGRLPAEWELVHATIDDASRTVFLLVREPGRPIRLYAVTDNFDKARKQAGQAQAQIDRGLPVHGRGGEGSNEGEFVLYVLPPVGQPKAG